MITTKNEPYLDVDHFITGEESSLHRIANSLFNWLDVLLRNCAASDLVDEDKPFARCWLNLQFNVSILAATAGLFLVDFFSVRSPRNGFPICDLRLADIRFHTELALHTVHDDFEMELAHAGDDTLARLLIGR